MTAFDVIVAVHTIFAALWTGGAVLIAGAVIPAARTGLLEERAVSLLSRRFWLLSVTSILLLLFTGGHLAGTLYTFESLQTTGRGHLVSTMVFLWAALAITVHVGLRRLSSGGTARSVSDAATAARPWFVVASAVSVALLLVAGLL